VSRIGEDEMTVCVRCGRDNPADSRFCSSCGAPLAAGSPEAADAATTVIPAASAAGETTSALETHELEDDEGPDELELFHESLLPGTALLVVQRGPSAGSRFLLDADIVSAGRHPDSDIFLDDVTVSRRHAEFARGPEGFRVRDVGSLNGTYVNRNRIDDALLGNKDEVQIGKFRLVYVSGPAAGPDGPGGDG
jgi:hypothetical protein